MPLQAGIVGLPNVGKSTLFNAITRAGAETANYPFCTIDPNVGVVEVPDERLAALAQVVHPKRIVPAAFEFVDIAGLVQGASKGEGLGNKFLAHIREVDAIVHVVRCFEDANITHVSGGIDPERDIAVIHTELLLADLETVGRRLERAQRAAKSRDEKAMQELVFLERVQAVLDNGKPARTIVPTEPERPVLRDLHLLTAKPIIYVANVAEDAVPAIADPAAAGNAHVRAVLEQARAEAAEVVVVSAQIEAEVAELDAAEAAEFLSGLGLTASGLDRLIGTAYRTLGLLSFFTAGEPEVRAWTVRVGAKAPEAAGVIHSDFERGFIRAETIHWKDLVTCGSMGAAREKGLLRLEGKEYVVQDGDVMHFRFNV